MLLLKMNCVIASCLITYLLTITAFVILESC